MSDSSQRAEDNAIKFMKLVSSMSSPRKEKLEAMLSGDLGTSFFSSPASSRTSHHSAYPGGLCAHSLNVAAAMYKISQALCPSVYSRETVLFVALFHDLGKAGDGEQLLYIPNESEWHRERGMNYEINEKLVHMEHADRALWLLSKHGVSLSDEEWLAIRLHNGQLDETSRPYRMREPNLALLLHWADHWATMQEKKSDG